MSIPHSDLIPQTASQIGLRAERPSATRADMGDSLMRVVTEVRQSDIPPSCHGIFRDPQTGLWHRRTLSSDAEAEAEAHGWHWMGTGDELLDSKLT